MSKLFLVNMNCLMINDQMETFEGNMDVIVTGLDTEEQVNKILGAILDAPNSTINSVKEIRAEVKDTRVVNISEKVKKMFNL